MEAVGGRCVESRPFVIALACREMGPTPEEAARTGNPSVEQNLLSAPMRQLARSEDLLVRWDASGWDLIVVDEAHEMSAHLYGLATEKTGLSKTGEVGGGFCPA